ncbi:hypothetical protein ABZ626_37895 [Streptomyces longispororuber]|uniref:hypothetical protein n=1 Tax=Streptomyces longispororuber TaxID=68230 RepID=UPI0033DD0D63
MSTPTTPERFKDTARDAARAVQSGAWPIGRADMEAADIVLERLWTPYEDVLQAERPDPRRVRQRLEAVPDACAAARAVPAIDARLAELLALLPQALAETEQQEAVRYLGAFGTLLFAISDGEPWL